MFPTFAFVGQDTLEQGWKMCGTRLLHPHLMSWQTSLINQSFPPSELRWNLRSLLNTGSHYPRSELARHETYLLFLSEIISIVSNIWGKEDFRSGRFFSPRVGVTQPAPGVLHWWTWGTSCLCGMPSRTTHLGSGGTLAIWSKETGSFRIPRALFLLCQVASR